jgi:cell division protein FtsZ
MLEFPPSPKSAAPAVRFIGLGGAGANVLDRLILDGLDASSAIAMNSDIQALQSSLAGQKIQLGAQATRGLGAGGDPELGYTAAEEVAEEISASLAEAGLVFICAGLGGGIGSGAGPLVAHLARKTGAFVVICATLPFTFEGKRRGTQASIALAQLGEQADLILCFENDRLGEGAAPTAGVQQAFVAADQTLSQTLRALAGMTQRRGLVSVGVDHLATLLGRSGTRRTLFGYGESESSNRVYEALERALKNPLLDKGKVLDEAGEVLIQITGGPDLTLSDVSILMEAFQRHVSDATRVHFGLSTDARFGRRLGVAILATLDPLPLTAGQPAAAPAREIVPPPAMGRQPEPAPYAAPTPKYAPQPHLQETEDEELELLIPAALDRPPAPSNRATAPAMTVKPAAKKEEKAEQMALKPANRGRFEEIEPTIVDGNDLDVPTFMRKNLKVK